MNLSPTCVTVLSSCEVSSPLANLSICVSVVLRAGSGLSVSHSGGAVLRPSAQPRQPLFRSQMKTYVGNPPAENTWGARVSIPPIAQISFLQWDPIMNTCCYGQWWKVGTLHFQVCTLLEYFTCATSYCTFYTTILFFDYLKWTYHAIF